jgi:hypothetical protein
VLAGDIDVFAVLAHPELAYTRLNVAVAALESGLGKFWSRY